MSALLKASMIGLAVVVVAAAHASEQAPILNLRGIEPRTISVGGPGVLLTVTRQQAAALIFTNQVRVTYGADLVGFARIRQLGRQSEGDAFILRFETEEQAAAAERVLRLRDATPSPLHEEAGAARDFVQSGRRE
jgi:hypothetical protein